MCDKTKLNEYDKIEWMDVARQFKPDLTEAEYDQLWDDFCKAKATYLTRTRQQ